MTDIKIPIKSLLENLETKYNCIYEWDEECLIRRFFIGCLNMGYIEPETLADAVCKVTKTIKKIDFGLNKKNGLECYKIYEDTLFLLSGLKELDEEMYEKTVFKALSEVVLGINDKDGYISNVFSEMLAEKIYNMDVNGSRIIMPKTDYYKIDNGVTLELRAGYERYNLIINLLKQIFIAQDINENRILSNMIKGSYDAEMDKILSDKQIRFLFEMLEAIAIMDKKRIIQNVTNPKEIEYIVKYQKLVNNLFEKENQNYFAFCALITFENLRMTCMKKFDPDL